MENLVPYRWEPGGRFDLGQKPAHVHVTKWVFLLCRTKTNRKLYSAQKDFPHC